MGLSKSPAPRFPLNYSIRMKVPEYKSGTDQVREEPDNIYCLESNTSNMSASGMRIALPSGARVIPGLRGYFQLQYGHPSEDPTGERDTVNFHGEVIWVQGGNCGVQITQMDYFNQLQYDGLIDGYVVRLFL